MSSTASAKPASSELCRPRSQNEAGSRHRPLGWDRVEAPPFDVGVGTASQSRRTRAECRLHPMSRPVWTRAVPAVGVAAPVGPPRALPIQPRELVFDVRRTHRLSPARPSPSPQRSTSAGAHAADRARPAPVSGVSLGPQVTVRVGPTPRRGGTDGWPRSARPNPTAARNPQRQRDGKSPRPRRSRVRSRKDPRRSGGR